MFAMLTGNIVQIDEETAIIDCAGVGYLIHASQSTMNQLHQGETARLWIETKVRENEIALYGFLSQEEKYWFNLLVSVQGVGAKAALSILSVLTPEQALFAITSGDKASITRANGIGPKIATRIISELSEKVGNLVMQGASFSSDAVTKGSAPATQKVEASAPVANRQLVQELVSALGNLGYSPSDATKVSVKLVQEAGDDVSIESLIPAALQELSGNI